MKTRRWAAAAFAFAAIASLAACGGADADPEDEGLPETLRVGLIPNIAPEEQSARYQPFGDYLAEQLGVSVELFVATDYAGVVAALAGERIDLAYLGGLTYVQAEQQVELTPLVTGGRPRDRDHVVSVGDRGTRRLPVPARR